RNIDVDAVVDQHRAAVEAVAPAAALQRAVERDAPGLAALVEQHQRGLADVAALVDAVARRLVALELQVELQAALQRRRLAAQSGDALQRREDRALRRGVDAGLAVVVAVSGVLGAAAHEAGFRAV